MKTGHEDVDTDALMVIRDNLISGLKAIAKRHQDGTSEIQKKAGSTPPSQFAFLPLALLLGIEDELESRILGFERAIDPKMFAKTL